MAAGNILEMILKTINEVQQKNQANPREETAHSSVFDLIKDKLGNLDKNIQNKQAQQGKNPTSILDLIKNQIEAAKDYNQKDPDTPTAPGSVFDRILKKVEAGPKRAASAGVKRVIEEYNLDVSRLSKETLQRIQEQYDGDLRNLNKQYAQAITNLIQQS